MKTTTIERLDHIDALRGLAILLVILVHTSQSINNLHPILDVFSKYGQMGVQLFFLISGFTLSYSMDKWAHSPKKLRNYFIRRIFRIAPLYYFAIFFYATFSSTLLSIAKNELTIAPRYTVINILSNLSFTHGFHPNSNNIIVPGGWSIGTEMAFYLIFPFLFPLILWTSRLKAGYLLSLPVITLALAWAIQMYYSKTSGTPLQNNSFMYFNLANQLPVFTIGITTYFLVKKDILGTVSALISAAFFIVFTVISIFLMKGTLFYSFILSPTTSAISFVFLFNLFSKIDNLNPFWLRRIGQLSYSMYVFHFVFAWFLTRQYLNPLLAGKISPDIALLAYFIVVVVCTYFVSLFSERYIEIPGIKAGKKITRMSNAKHL